VNGGDCGINPDSRVMRSEPEFVWGTFIAQDRHYIFFLRFTMFIANRVLTKEFTHPVTRSRC
jgi:hypothetical protein